MAKCVEIEQFDVIEFEIDRGDQIDVDVTDAVIIDRGAEPIDTRLATVEDEIMDLKLEVVTRSRMGELAYIPVPLAGIDAFDVNNETLNIRAFKNIGNEILEV